MVKSFVAVLLIAKACLLILEISAQPELLIYPNQDHIIAPVNERLTVECECKECGDEDFKYMKWLNKYGVEITENVTKTDFLIKLTFSNPDMRDDGMYRCRLIELEVKVIIHFYEPITFEECPEIQHLILWRTGRIRCRATGNPMPVMIWKKDGSLIKPEQISNDEYVVTIPTVRKKDIGNYSVEAFVQQTGKSLLQNIHVYEIIPPRIKVPDEFHVIQGENNTIKCEATGSEPLTYKWYNNYGVDVSDLDRMNVGHKVDQGLLTISKVNIFVRGNYKCEVSNPAGIARASVHIIVQRSEICDKHCDDADFPLKSLFESNEDLKEICNLAIESMKCGIKHQEVCKGADVAFDGSLRSQYEHLAAYQEVLCSEDTLFHAVLRDNLKCLRELATFADSNNFTRQCYMDEGQIFESRIQKYIENLEEEGLVSMADYGNDSDKLRFCIKVMNIFACHALNIKDECGTVAMYVYVEITQKVTSLQWLCRQSFHLIPAIIRLIQMEEEKERTLVNTS